MHLYTNPVSNFCNKVDIALAWKGLDCERSLPPGGYGSDEYRKIVPLGTIPGLVDGDFVLSESELIMEYLEDAYPDRPALLPVDARERARVRLLSRYHDQKLEPHARALFKHMAPSQRDQAFVTEKFEAVMTALEGLERQGRFAPYLAGSAFSLADCAYGPTIMMMQKMFETLERDFRLSKPLEDWYQTLLQTPAVQEVMPRAVEATDAWVRRKLAEG
ncbi:glutathione S-transferase family protein [Kiloniella sp. b19]|uniref:glutathione S-transferase family protein n=1 Tax=Kiloniella sp. GXU_MW_B19 TaxID=3141326 RepID=UPI0031D9AB34